MNEEEHVVVPSVGEAFVGEDGTVSVVLSYDIDDAYEPTQDEIAEYAEWMGMKLPEDNEFLYIAREGLKAPLPQYWRPCRTNDDEIYYFNFKTGESTWSHPMDDYYREKFRKVKAEKENLGGGGAAQDNKIAVGLPFAMGKDEGSTLAKASALGKTAGHSAVLSDGARSPGVLSQVLPQPVSTVHGGPRPLDISNRSTSSLSEIGNSNKQIVSEAEKNLEEKIRRECEAVIVEEQKKAESALLERRQNMYRTHEAEMKKLRADHEAKLAALRSSAPLETEEALRERREATEKLTASLSQAKKEMEDLEKQLAQLKEEDVRSLASEVAKAEAAVGAEMEQLVKAVKADSMLLLEKMKGELRAEFELNMAELQKKAQEEARELNEAIEKAHAEEVAAIRQRVLDENTKSQVGGAVGDSLCSEGDEEAKIATIRAKEEEEVAAIRKRSAEEQAELRASMQAKIDELHEELCDLEGPIVISINNSKGNPPVRDNVLEEVCRHWQVEEARRLAVLREDREKKVAALEQISADFSSVLSLSTSGATSGAVDVPLAARQVALWETEVLLIMALQEELRRAATMEDNQLSAAIDGAFRIFVRSTEVRRRHEVEDFELQRDRVLADHAAAQALCEQKSEEQRHKLQAASRAAFEETVRIKVDEAIKAVVGQCDMTKHQLRERYDEERRALISAVDEEISATAEELRDVEQRLEHKKSIMEKTQESSHTVEPEVKGGGKVPQAIAAGIPERLLQERLASMERVHAEQVRELEAELASINASIQKIDEASTIQQQHSHTFYLDAHARFPVPRGREDEKEMEEQLLLSGRASKATLRGAFSADTSRMGSMLLRQSYPHSSSPSFEAWRFIAEQQVAACARREALQSAREEWCNGIRSSRTAPSPMDNIGRPSSAMDDDGMQSHLFTLVETLSNKLERLSGRVLAFDSPSPVAHLSPRKTRKRRQDDQQGRPCPASGGPRHTADEGSPHRRRTYSSPSRRHRLASLKHKWGQLLSTFSARTKCGTEACKRLNCSPNECP